MTTRLHDRIAYIYRQCAALMRDSIGFVPETAGNVAIFCQSEDEYNELQQAADQLVLPSDNPAQKYFQLRDPIIVPGDTVIRQTTLTWLYIRKPAADTPEAGDVDFIFNQNDYDKLKVEVQNGGVKNGSIYDRANWDMVEFRNQDYDGLPYLTTLSMAEKVRVRF